jgi:hypothetical protein
MTPDIYPASSARPIGYQEGRLRATWGERIVTVVAATTAVLIVALIAVLMGMA